MISPQIEERVWKILAGTATRNEMHVIRAGGIENHVHVLVRIPKTMSVSEAMKRLKGGSSKEINASGLMKSGPRFEWQDGYGAFPVSASSVPNVVEYIANQREYHRTTTFEEEFIAFLEKHDVGYDPKYLWS